MDLELSPQIVDACKAVIDVGRRRELAEKRLRALRAERSDLAAARDAVERDTRQALMAGGFSAEVSEALGTRGSELVERIEAVRAQTQVAGAAVDALQAEERRANEHRARVIAEARRSVAIEMEDEQRDAMLEAVGRWMECVQVRHGRPDLMGALQDAVNRAGLEQQVRDVVNRRIERFTEGAVAAACEELNHADNRIPGAAPTPAEVPA